MCAQSASGLSGNDSADAVLAFFSSIRDNDWDGAVDALDSNVHYEDATFGSGLDGPDALVRSFRGWKGGFPDSRIGEVRRVTASGATVVLEVVWHGTHTGAYDSGGGERIEATGAEVFGPAAIVATLRDGKIETITHYFDNLTVLAQLRRAAGKGWPDTSE